MMEDTATVDIGARRGRRSVGLPFEAWPEGDRALWNRIFPEDIDERNACFGGNAPRQRTMENTRQLLCRVNGFLHREMPNQLDVPFIDRFDEDTLALLVDDLADTCLNKTIRDYLKDLARHLKCAGGVAHVGFDRILRDLARNTSSEHRDTLPISSQQVADLAAGQMTKALAELATGVERTRAYNAPERFRNGYILLLLIKRPLRLTNLSQLVLEETFFRRMGSFEIRFSADMMKNGYPYSSVFDHEDGEFFDWTRRYLDLVLPCFPEGKGLLMSRQGGHLSPFGLHRIITETTRDLLGLRLTAHDFRRIFTDTAVANGRTLADINQACQRRPGSETVYVYKSVYSENAKRVARPMLENRLAHFLRQKIC